MQSVPTLLVNIGSYSAVPLTHVRLTTTSPGGCGLLTGQVEFRPPYLGVLALRENDRVEVFDAGGLVWRGRLEERSARIQFGSAVWTFTALGYSASLRDRFYTVVTTFASGTAIETIFTTVRNDLAPDISTDNGLVVATSRTLGALSRDMIGQSAMDVFDQAMALGDSNNNRLYWHIWEGTIGTTNEAVLELIARPTTPAYYVGLDQGAIVELNWALSRLYNRIVVRWGSTTTYTTRDDAASQGAAPDGYGVIRSLQIENTLINSAADAQNVGDALLGQYATVRPLARSIQIPASALIADSSGGAVRPWRVRSGRIIRVRELRAGAQRTAEHDFFIAATEWDEDSGLLTLTPEGPENVANLIARYLRRERLT